MDSSTAGHSLGGALATLAAYDIQQELAKQGQQQQQQQQAEVVCYSFGAPRTGNHAFARDYNHMVPDTWSIINGQARDLTTYSSAWLTLAVVAANFLLSCTYICVKHCMVPQNCHPSFSMAPVKISSKAKCIVCNGMQAIQLVSCSASVQLLNDSR